MNHYAPRTYRTFVTSVESLRNPLLASVTEHIGISYGRPVQGQLLGRQLEGIGTFPGPQKTRPKF